MKCVLCDSVLTHAELEAAMDSQEPLCSSCLTDVQRLDDDGGRQPVMEAGRATSDQEMQGFVSQSAQDCTLALATAEASR